MWLFGCMLAALTLQASAFDFTAVPAGSTTIPGWASVPVGLAVTATSAPAPRNATAVYVALNTSLTTTLPQATMAALTSSSSSGLSVSTQFRIHSDMTAADEAYIIASIAGVTLAFQPAELIAGQIETLLKDDFAGTRQGAMV